MNIFSMLLGRLLRCVRCPTAYHTGDFCIAAGSENLPGHNIVCSKHFQPNRTQKYHTHINVSWCFVCNLGKDKLTEQCVQPCLNAIKIFSSRVHVQERQFCIFDLKILYD